MSNKRVLPRDRCSNPFLLPSFFSFPLGKGMGTFRDEVYQVVPEVMMDGRLDG